MYCMLTDVMKTDRAIEYLQTEQTHCDRSHQNVDVLSLLHALGLERI